MKRALALLALGLGAWACGADSEPLTEIVVVVDSDLEIPGELDAIEIAVSGSEGMPSASAALSGGDLPRSLGLVHSGGPLGPVWVEARGLLGGALVVQRTAEVEFVRDRTLQLQLMLERACAERAEPCPESETCAAGACIPQRIERLPVFSGKLPERMLPTPNAGTGAAGAAEGGQGGDVSQAGGDAQGGMSGEPAGRGGAGSGGTEQAGRDASAGAAGMAPQENTAPTCVIAQPADKAQFYADDSVELMGSCSDAESSSVGPLVWRSGMVVVGSSASSRFTAGMGKQTISLCATDVSDSTLQGCAEVMIDVKPLPAVTAIIENVEQNGSKISPFSTELAISARGRGMGVAPVTLSWLDAMVGAVGSGEQTTLSSPVSLGKRALQLTATDARARTASAVSSYFTVLSPGQSDLFATYDTVNVPLNITGPAIALAGDTNNLFVISSSGVSTGQTVLYRIAATNTPATAMGSNALMGVTLNLRDVFLHAMSQRLYLGTNNGYAVCPYSGAGVDSSNCVYSKDFASNWVTSEINALVRVFASGNSKEYLVLGSPSELKVCDAPGCAGQNSFLPNTAVTDIAISGDQVWIATSAGLYNFDLTHSNGLSSEALRFIKDTPTMLRAVAAGSSVWMGSTAGLARYEPATKVITLWNSGSAAGPFHKLASNDVRALAVSRPSFGESGARDVVWIATGSGVSRFDPSIPSFITLTTADGLPSNSVKSVVVLPNGDKLFGTDGGIALYRGP